MSGRKGRQWRRPGRQERQRRAKALRVGPKRRLPIPWELREKVWERDGDICRRPECLRPFTAERRRTIHHLNGDPSDNRFDWNRDDLARNNLVQWCEGCQRKYHHSESKSRR